MKKVQMLLLFVLGVFALTGCAANQSVEKPVTVDYQWKEVCRCATLPAKCQIPSKHFDFVFDVTQPADARYLLEGVANVHLDAKTGGSIDSGTFTFLLVKEGQIIDQVMVNPRGSLWSKVPFKKEFTSSASFDAVMVTYNIMYK